jgi:hypothetical protein
MEPIGRAATTASPARAYPARPAAESGGFQVAGAPSAARTAAAALDPGVALAPQAGALESAADRAARRRGRDLLAALAALQHALLGGAAAPELLGQLADLAADVPMADRPDVAAAVQGIALRARVELARYGSI